MKCNDNIIQLQVRTVPLSMVHIHFHIHLKKRSGIFRTKGKVAAVLSMFFKSDSF